MNRVAVSGATSMLGVALIEECIKNNIDVIAIVRPGSKNIARIPYSSLVRIIECELENYEILDVSGIECDTFYHFAWDFTSKSHRDDPYLQNLNIGHTLNAVKLAYRLGCKTFIGSGSQAEYGNLGEALTHFTSVNPKTSYGIAKYAAGKLSEKMCNTYGMLHIWVRVLSVYGPYDNEGTLIRYIVESLLAGVKPSLTKCEQIWDYLYSEDAGRAFYLIGLFPKNGAIYCLGSGKSRKLKEYIDIISFEFGDVISIGIGEKEYGSNQIMHLEADISRLTEDTGFKPSVTFENGIRKTINFYRLEVLDSR